MESNRGRCPPPSPFFVHICMHICACVWVYTHARTCTHTHPTRPQEQMTENSVVLDLEYLKNEMKEYSAGRVK